MSDIDSLHREIERLQRSLASTERKLEESCAENEFLRRSAGTLRSSLDAERDNSEKLAHENAHLHRRLQQSDLETREIKEANEMLVKQVQRLGGGSSSTSPARQGGSPYDRRPYGRSHSPSRQQQPVTRMKLISLQSISTVFSLISSALGRLRSALSPDVSDGIQMEQQVAQVIHCMRSVQSECLHFVNEFFTPDELRHYGTSATYFQVDGVEMNVTLRQHHQAMRQYEAAENQDQQTRIKQMAHAVAAVRGEECEEDMVGPDEGGPVKATPQQHRRTSSSGASTPQDRSRRQSLSERPRPSPDQTRQRLSPGSSVGRRGLQVQQQQQRRQHEDPLPDTGVKEREDLRHELEQMKGVIEIVNRRNNELMNMVADLRLTQKETKLAEMERMQRASTPTPTGK